MSEFVVTHCDASMADCAELFLKSLAKCCHCIPIVYHYGMTDAQRGALINANHNARMYELTEREFVGRIATSKVECVKECARNIAAENDLILGMDVDILVKSDPFEMFEMDADVFVTKRGNEWKHPINGGVWGFRANRPGLKFIDFYTEQVHNKDWPPYRKYLKKFGHLYEVNWRVGQDFLNVIARQDMPFECEVGVLDDAWNYVHDSGAKGKVEVARQAEQDALLARAKAAYDAAAKDPRIRILHFKARMKPEMPRYARQLGIA